VEEAQLKDFHGEGVATTKGGGALEGSSSGA
jgi:hypothetical protein